MSVFEVAVKCARSFSLYQSVPGLRWSITSKILLEPYCITHLPPPFPNLVKPPPSPPPTNSGGRWLYGAHLETRSVLTLRPGADLKVPESQAGLRGNRTAFPGRSAPSIQRTPLASRSPSGDARIDLSPAHSRRLSLSHAGEGLQGAWGEGRGGAGGRLHYRHWKPIHLDPIN